MTATTFASRYVGLIDLTGAVPRHEAPEGTGPSAPAGELEEVLR